MGEMAVTTFDGKGKVVETGTCDLPDGSSVEPTNLDAVRAKVAKVTNAATREALTALLDTVVNVDA